MFEKVLVLSASAGAGHVRAAQAIEKAIGERGASREVRHVDTLQYTNKLFRNLYTKAYIDMVNKAPDVLGWLYDQYDKPWKSDPIRVAFDKLNTIRFVKMLRDYDPDIVICTHFLPATIISYLNSNGTTSYRQGIVLTDFDVHAMWLCHHCEHYFVPLDETREHLVRLGVSRQNVTVSGIPIDSVFSIPKEKATMRRKYGLREDGTTILISAGGFGVGPIENMMTVLSELRHRSQVIALCGRNDELRQRIEAIASGLKDDGTVAIRALGYTTEMDEYMAASDILLGKPGGLTTSEALARGLAFVIVNPIPGQEERNADHLLEEGVAIRSNNLPTLAYKIDRLLDNSGRLAIMQERACAMARPDAAFTVVDTMTANLSQASSKPEQ